MEGNVTASFNPRKVYEKHDFPDALFPDALFPDALFSDTDFPDANAKTADRNAAKNAVVKAANNVANDSRSLIKGISFKSNTPFVKCISKINETLIDNEEDLDVAIPMYNLLEYSKNYRKTTESL